MTVLRWGDAQLRAAHLFTWLGHQVPRRRPACEFGCRPVPPYKFRLAEGSDVIREVLYSGTKQRDGWCRHPELSESYPKHW